MNDNDISLHYIVSFEYRCFSLMFILLFIMPPTLKKLEGHIAFGLSVCVSVCLSVCVLTFEW